MSMGPAEIVASLKELCEAEETQLTTGSIVKWIDDHGGYGSDDELIAFAKKMKARQYARKLMFEDQDLGRNIKRLWSFPNGQPGRRTYQDISTWTPERRKDFVEQFAFFQDQILTARKAMSDFLAGQQFFGFYGEHVETESTTASSKN